MSNPHKYRFAIDRGGTFTDVYAELPENKGFQVVKLLSEDPDNYADAPREGIRRILEKTSDRKLPDNELCSDRIEWIRMGTTVATNALLERKGVRCALLITKGFRDLLRIGYQNRPRLFDLEISKPELLYEQVVEIDERIRLIPKNPDQELSGSLNKTRQGTTGESVEILQEPDEENIRDQLRGILDRGIDSLAVVLMHSYLFPDHEELIGRIALGMGFAQVSLSNRVMPMVRMVARGDTTTVDAYLTPYIRQYLESFRSGFGDRLKSANLQFMQSDGGLVPADGFKGCNAILSGPAGGVVGYAMTAWSPAAKKPIIGFDMGGTSTDVSRFGGDFDLTHETETAGVRIQAPQLNINTVAAGGGSRLFFENGIFKVGPESAGAHPGPICYRKSGYLTVTDANLLLGRIQPDYFPRIFGKSGNLPLNIEAVQSAFRILADEINLYQAARKLPPMTVEQIASGFIRVANESMIRPIREISVMRGYDIKEHLLACFGGAGGQHACAIARSLGISRIVIHRFGGILSAYGMGLADVVSERQEPAAVVYSRDCHPQLDKRFDVFEKETVDDLKKQGFDRSRILIQRYLNLRYQGTDTSLMLREPADMDYSQAFKSRYLREFGFDLVDRDILVDDIRVRAIGKPSYLDRIAVPVQTGELEPDSYKRVYFDNCWQKTPVYVLEELGAGQVIEAPAIIIQQTSTIVLEPGCRTVVTEFGNLEIDIDHVSQRKIGRKEDPIQLSIFGNLFMSIAEQMGRSLQKTAVSTNIKERQDFSCAVFDNQGRLVANAPHQPVHLGSMGEAVRRQIEMGRKDWKEGDVLLTNHPLAGGSHLPDLTVVTPVWRDKVPIFFVASRGHHADIGGISPGSMPPFSKSLEEEGVCIKSFKLVENGSFQEEAVRELFIRPQRLADNTSVPGARMPADNLSDLKAQVAANQKGIELLMEMVGKYSLEVVQAYMGHIQINADQAVRDMLRKFADVRGLNVAETILAEDFLDDGSPIRLKLSINRDEGSALFDFTGTGPEIPGNLNTPRAVTYSAILYCLRCLIRKDIPLNHGCLNPIKVILPGGSLLNPAEQAAVVGGNVLTSQRITDVIFKAFSASAASQGCMNNLTFGNQRFAYYETIGGGAGAGKGWHGQSGVHTHMTNTRITDPEILEKRYPVLLAEFSLRADSGGEGQFKGGEGIIREMEFLQPLNVAILSERRVFAPYGLEGGEPGKKGRNLFIRKDENAMDIGGKNELQAQPGDRIRIMTPGGGGYGKVTD